MDEFDFAARTFDGFGADDFVFGVVGTFHEDVGEDFFDEVEGSVVAVAVVGEEDDCADAFEGAEDSGAIGLTIDGA